MNSAKQKLSAGKLVPCLGLRQARSPDIAMIVMLETPQAIANADGIAAVPGVDLLLVGGIRGEIARKFSTRQSFFRCTYTLAA